MREVVYPDTEEGSSEFKIWLAQHHGHEPDVFPAGSYGYGVVDDGEIVFAAVIQTFHYPGDVLVQFFGSDPKIFFRKNLMAEVLTFPFRQPVNARRLTLVINGVHDRSIGVAERWGFRVEGRMPKHFEDDEAVILGYVRPDMEA